MLFLSLAFLYIKAGRVRSSFNLLIISVDTLRPDHMGVYGYSKNTTPNIDAWARDATVFTNARTVVPMTYPSFAALMTGKDAFHTRIIVNGGLPISANTQTLATILGKNGYKTAAYVTNAEPVSQGFGEFNTLLYKNYYTGPDGEFRYSEGSREQYNEFINNAGNWLSSNNNNKFFLWVHLMDPHEPYFPADDLKCKFNPEYCSQVIGKTAGQLEEERATFQKCQESSVPNYTIGKMETLYDGEIASADILVGKILKTLKQTGLDKNTIVVFYGDHGEGFDHNYYFNHGDVLYDSAVKIPLIIKTPGSNLRGKTNKLVQNVDIAPSILDMLRISFNGNKFDGISFSGNNLFSSPFPTSRKYSYSVNSTWTKYSVTDGEFKYIYSLQQSCLNNGRTEELYNLKNDPGETRNISNMNKNEAQTLKKRLFETLSQYNLPIERNVESNPDNLNDFKTLGY